MERTDEIDLFASFARHDIQTDNARIATFVGGEGPPLLLLHGFPQTHLAWHRVAPVLARHYTVVATDLRGYGDSIGPQGDAEHIGYSQVRTLADAHNIVRSCGYPNAGLLVDVLHMSRSGATPADLAQLPAGAIHYLHLCDAPRLAPADLAAIKVEARSGRLYPGEGDLSLREFVAAAGASVPVGIEAPDGRRARLSYSEQAKLARSATIRLLQPEHSSPGAAR